MDTLIFCFLMNFFIQFVGFVFAYTLQTEKFFDFFGEFCLSVHNTILSCMIKQIKPFRVLIFLSLTLK